MYMLCRAFSIYIYVLSIVNKHVLFLRVGVEANKYKFSHDIAEILINLVVNTNQSVNDILVFRRSCNLV